MTVVGIGLDLVELDRFRRLYGNFDPDVLDRCFTAGEQASVGTGKDRLTRLAARFAAKEAVLKTIGGLQDGIALTDRTRTGASPKSTSWRRPFAPRMMAWGISASLLRGLRRYQTTFDRSRPEKQSNYGLERCGPLDQPRYP